MYSTCLHLPQAIFPGIPQKKDLWRFLWDNVVPQEGNKRSQDHWQRPVCVCCLASSQGHRKWFMCPSGKKPPLPPKHPRASPIWHEGKCVPYPKSDDYFMHPRQQVGAPAYSSWYPWSYCRQCLLLQKAGRRNYFKNKTNWEASLISKKKEWPAETWSLILMWHNSSHEQQTSHLLSVLIRRSKYETAKDWWLKH